MKFIKLMAICLACSFFLFACDTKSVDTRYTGIRADEDIIESIRQEMQDKEDSMLANEGDVFWTESGKLWHNSHECSYLANSKTVLHGTIEEARLEGKEKACERCSSSETDSIYESLESNEYKQGDVFFTKDGTVWHTNINCKLIVGAQKVYFANEITAKLLGKTSSCTECED